MPLFSSNETATTPFLDPVKETQEKKCRIGAATFLGTVHLPHAHQKY